MRNNSKHRTTTASHSSRFVYWIIKGVFPSLLKRGGSKACSGHNSFAPSTSQHSRAQSTFYIVCKNIIELSQNKAKQNSRLHKMRNNNWKLAWAYQIFQLLRIWLKSSRLTQTFTVHLLRPPPISLCLIYITFDKRFVFVHFFLLDSEPCVVVNETKSIFRIVRGTLKPFYFYLLCKFNLFLDCMNWRVFVIQETLATCAKWICLLILAICLQNSWNVSNFTLFLFYRTSVQNRWQILHSSTTMSCWWNIRRAIHGITTYSHCLRPRCVQRKYARVSWKIINCLPLSHLSKSTRRTHYISCNIQRIWALNFNKKEEK